jgi:hypothetical protein
LINSQTTTTNMIHQLATRYRKGTACFLMSVFYLQLALPSVARAFEPERPVFFRPAAGLSPIGAGNGFNATRNLSVTRQQADAGTEKARQREEAPEIGGPGQPEMSSFKSVNASDMVDLFSGDFSYNIPLMDVGGYPVNIHYSSNVSMDQEASWVGLGWNLNPGTVNRSTRGMPDDFNGTDTLTRTQSIKPNQTVGVRLSGDLEILGFPKGLTATLGVFKNTYSGWGLETGINASINSGRPSRGLLSGSLGISNNTQSGLDISPSLDVQIGLGNAGENARTATLGLSTNYNTRAGISALRLSAETRTISRQYDEQGKAIKEWVSGSASYPGGVISFATPSYAPTISMPLTNKQFTFRAKVGLEKWVAHPSPFAVEGYVSKQEIAPEDTTQTIPAVGYLYYSKANGRSDVLMDFNREKELVYNNKTTPHIAIPQYTYDVFSISGEGTGGMFRAYRGDVGYMRDYNIRSRSKSDRFSVDLGFGNIFHGGVDFSFTNAYTENTSWSRSNDMNQHVGFRDNDTTYQAVYFRNPGEMTGNSRAYYQSVGDDALMRVKLQGQGQGISAANAFEIVKNGRRTADLPVTSALVKKQRDKRSQVISYLTAAEASEVGLQREIVSYKENAIPLGACADSFTVIPRVDGRVRKGHHLSQVTVLNGDGRRYIYGIPAYNVEQKDVTFSVNVENDAADLDKGLADYTKGVDNSTANSRGKEGVFTRDHMPAHAHSFLLSGIVSPDYVDVKSDGISEDDIGDAVKFNYSRIYGGEDLFAWRTPHQKDKASYNDGLKTYDRDEKGTYIYGRKEVWYLNSIESKTMIAVFHVKNDRKDIYSVKDENGGLDTTKKLRRLDKIELYVKADLVKNGTAARPVKTVHFAYSYKLCKGVVSDVSTTTGKLTLDSVWFSYNGNEKGRLNPYIFRYHEGSTAHNPDYNPKHYDRWGNYKNPASNPGGLNNSDYPYVAQGSVSDTSAAAWVMNGITLPSGGKIQVTYEADDYAWVQNKRAAQFYTIKAIGNSPYAQGNELYSGSRGTEDHHYVIVESPVPLADTGAIRTRFLQGLDFVYFRLYVKMPSGGYEFVPVYAQVAQYGLVPNSSNRFWLRLNPVKGDPALARSALQFLRLNLPSQAYPASETGDNISLGDAVRMLVSSYNEVKNAVNGFDDASRVKGWCKKVDLSRSFIRLNHATMRKRGGGLRVKRVEVSDNWNKMTNQREAKFGQEYTYTTTYKTGDTSLTVSSGVASYEPMIGAEENPFRVPIAYSERVAPLAPANNLFSEEPLGESYFPSASVGYSKVRVRTINAKARSANGWTETEFYTTKDFPTLVEHTLLDDQSRRKYKPALGNFLRIYAVNHVSVSQGFKIELNDMNGKMKAQYSYAETDSLRPINYVLNFYKTDSDKSAKPRLNNNVWLVDSLNGHIDKNGQIGKDIEVMLDMRQQTSVTLADNRSVNLDIFSAGIWIIGLPSHYHLPQYEEERFRSAATVKIVQRYGILDSVVAMDKGSLVSTKNLVYDGETGEVVLSRTQNEFNDPVYNFSYPAHWAYSGMGMAYRNIDAVFSNLKLVRGKLYYGGASLTPFPVERFFESGDELILKGTQWPVPAAAGASCLLFDQPSLPVDYSDLVNRAWVMDAGKDIRGKGKGLYLIDSNGRTLTGKVDALRVLRSGKRNLLNASVGSIVSLANPIKETSPGNFYLLADSLTRVINTSAVTYKDQWRVENSYYFKDSCYTSSRTVTATLPAKRPVQLRLKKEIIGNNVITDDQISGGARLVASYDYISEEPNDNNSNDGRWFKGMEYRTKGILDFDFQDLPHYNKITNVSSAVIEMITQAPGELWPRDKFNFKCSFLGNRCDRYNHHWANDTNRTSGNHTFVLKRIKSPWNANTKYLSFGVASENQAVISSDPPVNSTHNLTCTDLVRDIIQHKLPTYGIMMELQNPIQTSGAPHFYSTLPYSKAPAMLQLTYTYSVDSCKQLCLADISDTLVNPYKWGLLGNWRMDRAYTFYHERKEGDASTAATDIRKDGELKNFTPFWKFTPAVLAADADTAKWVWNSASSQYNRKGFEIENYDPLGRYNSGLYGYNQTLPVAVAQNSRYREILFDGFEDYGYRARSCDTCKTPREFDFVKGNANVSTTQAQAHSGRYSIKLLANAEAKITVPIGVAAADTSGILMKVDSSAVTNTVVNGSGTGLNATYQGYSTVTVCPVRRHKITDFDTSLVQGPIDYQWGKLSPFSNLCRNWFTAKWTGYIQAPETDWYTFHARSDGGMTVRVNGVNTASALSPNLEIAGKRIRLERGKIYPIEVFYQHLNGSEAHARLRWSSVLKPQKETVPQQFLYPDTDTSGSMIQNPLYHCYSPANPKQQDMTRTGFSPLQRTRMVVSAWVRMDGADCNTATPLQNVVKVTTWGSTETHAYLEKTGVRIEGWQRYEGVVTMPHDGNQLRITITAPGDRAIYVDDIRAQPFNSHMKGYVYDPENLRLMAELDENNYAAFYEYDDDGTLVRLKKETERGIMTIRETRSALKKD